MKRIIVFDTNVLLNDPHSIFAYADAEIVIPQVVLSELDKLKTTRTDRILQYKGREVSRILFELSEYGQLTEGIELENNSVVKVVPFDPAQWPSSLNSKNADDRILGCAWQIMNENPKKEIILLTNDLNMLLKAQTLGVRIQRHELESPGGWLSLFLSRLGRKRVTFLWLAIPFLLVVLFVALWLFRVPSPLTSASVSPLTSQLESFAVQEVEYVKLLRSDPNNLQAWIRLGNIYLNWGSQYQAEGRLDESYNRFQRAEEAYSRALDLDPRNSYVQTNLGIAYSYLGNVQQAINEYLQVITRDPDYAPAHFNLAIILLRHNEDLKGALREFEAYLRLEPEGAQSAYAREMVKRIKAIQSQPSQK